MATVPASATATTTWQWPADVLEFARKSQLEAYLDPLLEATRRVYPTALSIRVTLDLDPEIRDLWSITFTVEVPQRDIPNFVDAVHAWTDELDRICPGPRTCIFRLFLSLIEP